MEHQPEVVDKSGRRGTLGAQVTDPQTGSAFRTVHVEDGRSILVLSELLITREDGSYYLPLDLDELEQQRQGRTTSPLGASGPSPYTTSAFSNELRVGEEIVVPVIEEEIQVGKRQVQRGTVRVHKRVREREELVSETLAQEEVEVERVPINEIVASTAQVRQEGDTVIIPVYEEVAVVEKRLVLKEEIRLNVRRLTRDWSDRVTVRSEEIEVERNDDELPT